MTVPNLSFVVAAPPLDEVRARSLELAIKALGIDHTGCGARLYVDLAAKFEDYLRRGTPVANRTEPHPSDHDYLVAN